MIRERQPMLYSGIFFDGADLIDFEKWIKTGILGGATTNPVILKKANVLDVPAHITRMIEIAGKGFPISVEIPDTRWTIERMVELGQRYRDMFPDNAVVKVPMDPRRPTVCFEVMHILAGKGVRINATFGMTAGQLILAAEALRGSKAEGDNYLSLFWNRRNEAKEQMIEDALSKVEGEVVTNTRDRLTQQIYDAAGTLTSTLAYIEGHGLNNVRVLVASVRSPWDVDQAFALKTDIVTINPTLLEKWLNTNRGIETSNEFNEAFDSVKDQVKII